MNAAGRIPRQEGSRGTPRAVRLIFEYEGDRISLVSTQTVEMIVPPSDPYPVMKQESGFWYELKDGDDKTLYRRVVHNPIRRTVELRSDDPDRPFTRQEVKIPLGTFVLLVPDLREARNVALLSSPPGREMVESAQEIARFKLKKGGKGREG